MFILKKMNKTLHVLMLAYYFPPDSSSGAFRPLFFSKYLSKKGIKVTVLTARETDFLPFQVLDKMMLSQIPSNVRVVRTRVLRPREFLINLKHKFSKKAHQKGESINSQKKEKESFFKILKDIFIEFFAIPDAQMGWIPIVLREGIRIIKKNKIDVIYVTGSPWSSMIAGVLLRSQTGVPLVLDFRDPWVSNPGFILRSKLSRLIEKKMERKIISNADAVIANTSELRDDFLKRYPFLTINQVYTINNGFEDHVDFKAPKNSAFTMVHTGDIYFSRNPLPLLQAVYNLIFTKKIPKNRLRLFLIGDLETAIDDVRVLLNTDVLKNVVQIFSRLPYEKSLKYQIDSDALILIQPDLPLQVPRKLYDYMAVRKPILAITNSFGATASIVNQYGIGEVVTNATDSIQEKVLKLYNEWENFGTKLYPKSLTHDFINSRQAEKLVSILDSVINS
ncbi:MAG: glycosyltransferase [Desulfobacterales bacterium]|nr:glycosyltransferase [Desulfobacterales bacterium]